MTSETVLTPTGASPPGAGLRRLFENRLPLNRKEVFFTATVLPAIICADGFAHFHRFLDLLGLRDIPIDVRKDSANIQFFTEYGLAESIYGERANARFPNPRPDRDRPDVMIFIEGSAPLLIAIEAKLYTSAQPSALKEEMERQKTQVLEHLRKHWPELRIHHAALLPDPMKREFGDQGPMLVITWDEVLRTYEDVESAQYFCEILRIALEGYPILKSPEATFGAHAEGKLTGAEILRCYQSRDTKFQAMGRRGGIDGAALKDDIAENRWEKQEYEVRSSPDDLPANWFRISGFVTLVSRQNLITAFERVVKAARDEATDDAAFGRRVRQLIKEKGGVERSWE